MTSVWNARANVRHGVNSSEWNRKTDCVGMNHEATYLPEPLLFA
jgi:hypothetical protein